MRMQSLTAMLTAGALFCALVAAPIASASPGSRGVHSAPRVSAPAPGRSVRQAPAPSNRGQAVAQRGSSRNLGTPATGTSRNIANPYNSGLGAIGQAVRSAQEERRHRDYRRDVRRSNRDAAIAVAVVGIAGAVIAATAAPKTPAYCTQPTGHYVTERVLVREGHHVEERVWVPEYRDRATGALVRGHYQTHVRWMPPVYEERQVWRPY